MSDNVPKNVEIPEDDPSLDLSLSLSPPGKREEKIKEIFRCQFCGKEFRTSQALGGHQNAHKYERGRRAEAMKIANGEFVGYFPMYPHGSSQHLLNGPQHRYLGVNRSATIYKPNPINMTRLNNAGRMQHMVRPQQFFPVHNVRPSWPTNDGNQAVGTRGFKRWTPIDGSHQGASGSIGGTDTSKGGSASNGSSPNN